MRYLVAEGGRWASLPADFPKWRAVYQFFRRWRDNDFIKEIYGRLRAMLRALAGKKMHVLPAPRPAFRGRMVTPGFLRRRRERRAAAHLEAQLQESADAAGRPGRRPVRALRVPTSRDG